MVKTQLMRTAIVGISLFFSIGLVGNVYAQVDQSLINQGVTEAMKAAGYMRDITNFVELCSYQMQYDTSVLQNCVNFTVELNNAIKPLLDKYDAN